MKSEKLKEMARAAGADLIGIAPEERWSMWPAQQNPKTLLPTCRSVVVVGRRVLRGNIRGIEEGTSFSSTYQIFGASWMENTFLPRTIYAIAHAIEAEGYEAVPRFGGTSAGASLKLDSMALGHAAGLGEVGKGGFFLTRKYGHRQRLALILTDLELEGDPLDEPGFCDGCDACLQACPLGALSECGKVPYACNTELCRECTNGALAMSETSFYSLDRLAASCGRACMVALEEKIENRFAAPFRKRSVWSRDLAGNCTVTPLTEVK